MKEIWKEPIVERYAVCKTVRVASLGMSDTAFVAALDSCSCPAGEFRHGDHLRLAWILLHSMPFNDAMTEIRRLIRAFGRHHGKATLYHETVTRAWVLLLSTHNEPSFEMFLRCHGHRLSVEMLHQFWTPLVLATEAALAGWVEPDIRPLPLAPSSYSPSFVD